MNSLRTLNHFLAVVVVEVVAVVVVAVVVVVKKIFNPKYENV